MTKSDYERTKIDGDRHYVVGGEAYVSVTTATNAYAPKQEALESWKKRTDNFEQVRDRAGVLGTAAHHRILGQYANGKLELPYIDLSVVDGEMETDVETAELLWDKCDFELTDRALIERRVAHHGYKYAGTFDAYEDGAVIDLKTSPTVHDSYKMQVAAYREAMIADPDYPDPEEAVIVIICPDPDKNKWLRPRVKRYKPPELDRWFDTFLDVLETYRG